MNYAIVDSNGNIANVIAWDGASPYSSGAGLILVQSDTVAKGDVYQDGVFTKPSGG